MFGSKFFNEIKGCLNPYFIGLSILIHLNIFGTMDALPVSILILLDYLFLLLPSVALLRSKVSLNPYFIGLSILMKTICIS